MSFLSEASCTVHRLPTLLVEVEREYIGPMLPLTDAEQE